MFIVELSEKGDNEVTSKSEGNEDRKVVIRFYGSSFIPNDVLTSSKSNETTESMLVSKLSELNLCPKLLATFPGGRIEPFVEGRIVSVQELNDNPEMNIQIAHKLALIHSLSCQEGLLEEVGIDRNRILFTSDILDNYVADFVKVKSELKETIVDEDAKTLLNHDFELEKIFLIDKFEKLQSRIVFSHNDLHHKNIYLRNFDQNNNNFNLTDFMEDRILLMDYEYASMNYRWADLAVYFTGNITHPNNFGDITRI